jgi:PD-(D/E)XK nuclease superfamily
MGTGMDENLVSVFSRGNQELFHSAFLAWLLRPTAAHGLGGSFLREVVRRLPLSYSEYGDRSGECDVKTEFRERRSRFDIRVSLPNSAPERRGLIFENKVKSFGNHLQLDAYQARGYQVAVFVLLPETLDAESRSRYPVVHYKNILEILRSLPLRRENCYHFMTLQYAEFLEHTTVVFDVLREFMRGTLDAATFRGRLTDRVQGMDFSDNDIRTFSYFYYQNFADYLKLEAADLWFGDADYQEGEKGRINTRWLCEKNMQGPPFMEAILYNPFDPKLSWRMHDQFRALFAETPFRIAPRVELRLDPVRLAVAEDRTEVGKLMLGTWSNDLRQMLREKEPYKSRFKPFGSRNFDKQPVCLADLPFSRLADRIRKMLTKGFDDGRAR